MYVYNFKKRKQNSGEVELPWSLLKKGDIVRILSGSIHSSLPLIHKHEPLLFFFFFSLTSCVLSRWLCHVLHTRDRLIYWFWMLHRCDHQGQYRSVSFMYLDFPLHWSSDKVLIFLNKLNNEMSLFFFLSIVETVSADLTFFYF